MSEPSQVHPRPLFPATAPLPGLDEPDWTENELSRGIPTSGLYLQLTVIWMQLIVSSRSTKAELFWVWASSALDSEGRGALAPDCHSWACLSNPRVTQDLKSYPQRENRERRDWGGHHMTCSRGSMKRENI